jgi:hypothetical protein
VPEEKRIPLRFLAAPLAFAFICIIYFAFDFYLQTKEKQIRTDFERSFPADRRLREANHSANALPGYAFKIGISIQTGHGLPLPPEFLETSAKFSKVWDELNHYVKAEALTTDPPVGVPEQTKNFLQSSESGFQSIIRFLVDEDSPRWREDPTVESDFIPVLIAVIRVHHSLAAHALYSLEMSQPKESEQALMACWKLNESLRSRREPISIVVAIKCSTIQTGLLKKLPVVPASLRQRMRSLDYRKNLMDALVLESGRLFDTLNDESQRREFMSMKFSRLPDWLEAPAFAILDPYIRLSRVNFLATEMELLEELRKGKAVKVSDSEGGLFSFYDYDTINTTLLEFEKMRNGL